MIYLRGVAVIVKSLNTGKILTVRELCSKKGIKQRGQLSIPAETVEDNESDLEAFFRLMREEVGANIHMDVSTATSLGVVHWIQNEFLQAEVHVWVICQKEEVKMCPGDTMDVEYFGWLSPEELLCQDIRPGIRETMQEYLSQRIEKREVEFF